MIQCKCIALIIAFVVVAGGQDYGVPGEYLTLNFPSAAAMGYGGGSTALTDNSDALYVNPAGIGFARYMESSISYSHLGTGLNYYPAAFCAPLGRLGSAGISYVGHLSPEAPGYDDFGIQRESYRAGANSIAFSYAQSIKQVVSFGGSFRFATERVATYSDVGFGMDLGLQIRPFPWIAAGAAFINLISPKMKLYQEDVSYGTTLRGGFGVRPLYPFISSERAKSLTLSFDGMMEDCFSNKKEFSDGKVDRPKRMHGGVSFEPLEFLVIRAGANDRLIDMGFGVTARGISTDAAIGIHHSTDGMNIEPDFSFGIRYAFGRPLSKQQMDVDIKENDVNQKADLAKGREQYILGNFSEAHALVSSYCKSNPLDRSASKFLADIDKKLSNGSAGEFVRRAQSELDRGNIADAARLVDQAISSAPADSSANALKRVIVVKKETSERLKKVAVLFDQEKYDDVERELNIVHSLDSTNNEIPSWRQKIASYLKKRDAERLVASASKNYYDGHKVEKASSDLQTALSLDPENKDALALYEKISREVKEMYLKKIGQMVEGQNLAAGDANLKKLVALDVQDRIIRIRRLVDDNQFDQAVSDLKVVLRDSPADTQALALMVSAEYGQRVQQSEVAYGEALKLYNDGNLADAENRVNKAVSLDSSNSKARVLQIDISKKNRQVFLDVAQTALEKGTRELLDQARIKIDDYLRADSSSDTAKRYKHNIEAQLMVLDASAAIEKGDYEQAQVIIQNALRISPDNRKVQDAYKNLKDAMEALK